MTIVCSLAAGTIWVFMLLLGRPAARYRRRTRWVVRPVAEVVGPDVFVADVKAVVGPTEGELRRSGFEPYVSFRMLIGRTAGRSIWDLQVVWCRWPTNDVAQVAWQQVQAEKHPTRLTAVELYFNRRVGPTERLMSQTLLADRTAGGRLGAIATPDDIKATYERFASDGHSRDAVPWRYADAGEYLAAVNVVAAERQADWLAGTARPDRSGRWYVYTWRSALATVVRHQFGAAGGRPEGRGFEVIPLAASASDTRSD